MVADYHDVPKRPKTDITGKEYIKNCTLWEAK